jgi:predicted metal-dependent peptidase
MADYVGIEREIIELILQRKYFYGHFLQQFKRHTVNKTSHPEMAKVIRTLAVNITSDLKPNLFINTDFYSSGDYDPENPSEQTWGMTQEEKLSLLEHEILHILNKHLIRIENRHDYVWNLATDLAINQYIKGLPHGFVCPDCNVFVRLVGGAFPKTCPLCKKALDPDLNKCEPLMIDKFIIDKEKIGFNHNNPSETYYDILWQKLPKTVIVFGGGMTDQRIKEAKSNIKDTGGDGDSANGDGNGQGQGQGESEQKQKGKGGQKQSGAGDSSQGDSQQNGQGQGDSRRGLGNGIIDVDGMKIPISIDNHETWHAGADNKEMAHEKIRDMVEKTMHRVNEKSQGHFPDYLKGLVEEVLAHKTVSWKSILRKFYGYEEFSKFISSRKRINRRFPIVQPGYVVQRKAHFVVATDSSGSVGDDEYGKFFKEISIMHSARIGITHVECDADIQKVDEYKKRPAFHKHERIGYGGTDFRPVFKFVKDRYYKNGKGTEFKIKGKIDGIIYLTDGYGTYPQEKDIICPVIWVMTPKHSDYGWNEKLGKKIIMEDD